ncbi:outer membrane protein with beta-barrel domain [Chitinophaga skermanii]|uniref:Outer membrane protein with beta-barrel domain n=1 Tax=Chitinophaga skermanii TaxID=331697 RepID=A0A327QHU9_9BACT|nr:outer membrane beta-barrel protein [Chitinophaga skermanii]RAJ04186.1 outer membrane protein with beta-barrel domain [Chitinophaga skermanii]
MTAKFWLCSLLCLLCTIQSQAGHYEKGTIYKPNGDSLQGYIENTYKDKTPQYILFKTTLDATAITYLPTDLAGFYYAESDERFKSMQVKLDVTTRSAENLATMHPGNRNIQDKRIFAQCILKGQVSLYEYDHLSGTGYFIVEDENGGLTVLNNTVVYNHNSSALQTLPYYRTELLEIVGNCVNEKTIDATPYTAKGLKTVIKQYLSCKYGAENMAITEKVKAKAPVQYGFMGGVGITKFEWEHVLNRFEIDNYFTPTIGVFVKASLSKKYLRWAAIAELQYRSINLNGNYFANWNLADPYKVDIDLDYVQLNVIGEYTHPFTSKIKPRFGLGIGSGFMVRERNNSYSKPTEGKKPLIEGYRKYDQSWICLVGMNIGYRWDVDARYDRGAGFANTIGAQTIRHTVYLITRYRL